MQTLLDDAKTWFLDRLVYAEEIGVVVVEGFRGGVPEDIQVGEHVIRDAYPVEPRDDSRRLLVRFCRPVAWQVVDESYTSANDTEVRDDDCFLQVLSSSPYLEYVTKNHGWYTDVVGPARHYRLWTEDNVIDVVAHDEPVVETFKGT